MKPLLDPLAMCLLLHLSMKMAFLVAITSARRVGKLGALMADPPHAPAHAVFFKEKGLFD